jgi:tetratricopeptide (TPR) repeat protein
LADAHSALGHTKDAVDAASAAIVCWGPQQQQRRDAMGKLKQVLESSKNLLEYVEQLNAQTAETGQDSPTVRKAIGQAFQSRREFSQAATQFQITIELQPTDREAYEGLIACDDALGKQADGTRQMERLIELENHNLKLYEQLAERLKETPAECERAATSIVEVGPQEAEIRQRQNRWNEAIDQWQHVARLRSLEPTGLLKLAAAQVHQKQWDAARQSIEKLHRTEWPTRFGDVNSQTRQLEQQLPK